MLPKAPSTVPDPTKKYRGHVFQEGQCINCGTSSDVFFQMEYQGLNKLNCGETPQAPPHEEPVEKAPEKPQTIEKFYLPCCALEIRMGDHVMRLEAPTAEELMKLKGLYEGIERPTTDDLKT